MSNDTPVRLDETTLTEAEIKDLTDTLLRVPLLISHERRAVLLEKVQQAPEVGGRIQDSNVARDAVWNLWKTCSELGFLNGLMERIASLDGGTDLFLDVQKKKEAYQARARERAPILSDLNKLVSQIQSVEGWEGTVQQHREQAVLPLGSAIGPRDQSLSDFLRSLADLPADPDGEYFPLFSFLERLFVQLFPTESQSSDLLFARALLDAISLRKGVTPDGIRRLREAAQDPDVVSLEEAFLVVIEPGTSNPKVQGPPYALSVFKWTPHPPGVPKEIGPGVSYCLFRPTLFNSVDAMKQKAAEVLASPLAEKKRQLVEFLVPVGLLCEPFELLIVDIAGEEALFGPDPKPLYEHARVVVRSWERSQSRFDALIKPAWKGEWKRRWGIFAHASNGGGSIASSIVWADVGTDTVTELEKATYRDACCVGARFAPVCPDTKTLIAKAVLMGGMPVALWLRGPEHDVAAIQAAIQEVLRRDGSNPADLRERVRDLRLEGKQIALLWDDPRRLPTGQTDWGQLDRADPLGN